MPLYLDQMFYSNVLDDEQADVQADFSTKDFDIVPVSDPNSTTMMQRLMKAKAMLELRGQGLNDQEILRRYLLAMDTPDVEQLFHQKKINSLIQWNNLLWPNFRLRLENFRQRWQRFRQKLKRSWLIYKVLL